MNEEKKKEFEGKFTMQYSDPDRDNYGENDWAVDPLDVWQWIDSELKQARIDENKYWQAEIDRRSGFISWREFNDRIKELEK